MPSESASCLSSALLTALPDLVEYFSRFLLSLYMGIFSCFYTLHTLGLLYYCRKCTVFKNPHFLVSLTALSLNVVFSYSQDPVWSRPTFLFLRTFFVGLLSSMEWSITKVSVAKHSGTPVFKVSNLLSVWNHVLVKYFKTFSAAPFQ